MTAELFPLRPFTPMPPSEVNKNQMLGEQEHSYRVQMVDEGFSFVRFLV